MTPQILIVCGPTGSGKSNLAHKLAKILDTEIISADSLAIYQKLDIGTAKPTKQELQEVTHQLIDVVSPFDTFSVSDYEKLALPHIDRLIANGKIPIICGGTGFYINSVLYKMSYGSTNENLEIREKYMQLAKTNGVDYVYEELKKCNVYSRRCFYPLLTSFAPYVYGHGSCPVAENLASRVLTLPTYYGLPLEDVRAIAENVREIVNHGIH